MDTTTVTDYLKANRVPRAAAWWSEWAADQPSTTVNGDEAMGAFVTATLADPVRANSEPQVLGSIFRCVAIAMMMEATNLPPLPPRTAD